MTKKLKTFRIPVEWSVWERIEVTATSIEEAVEFLRDNLDEIRLGTEPEYLEGTYKISETEETDTNEKVIKKLQENWNCRGEIDGADYGCNTRELYEEYKKDWCEDRGYKLEDVDEEVGINGECYVCYEEFLQNDLPYYANRFLI